MGLKDTVTGTFARVRQKLPWLDHVIQAASRYGADQSNNLAAAITYYSFLSLFPILLLALSILGFVLHGNPDLQNKILSNIGSALPGKAGAEVLNTVKTTRGASGVVGLLGLLYSGLGWVGNLRTALRTIWHQNVNAGNIIKSKLNDLVILIGLGIAVLVSVAISGVGNAATSFIISHIGLGGSTVAAILTKILTVLVAIAADVVIFLWLFIRLPKVETPWRKVLKGALFAAVGFEILKIFGAYYIQHTVQSGSKTYGTLATVVGILVWINLVSRFVLFAGEWTVTAPYDDDVPPSGTANPEQARKADVPEEFADSDADDAAPPQRQQDDAPTPLTPAIQNKPGVGFRDADRRRRGKRAPAGAGGGRDGRQHREQAAGPHITVVDAQRVEPLPHERTARAAGRFGAGALLAGAAGVLLLGARSVRDLAGRR